MGAVIDRDLRGEKMEKFHIDATVSATALYLLTTLTEEHIIYEDNQMLP